MFGDLLAPAVSLLVQLGVVIHRSAFFALNQTLGANGPLGLPARPLVTLLSGWKSSFRPARGEKRSRITWCLCRSGLLHEPVALHSFVLVESFWCLQIQKISVVSF